MRSCDRAAPVCYNNVAIAQDVEDLPRRIGGVTIETITDTGVLKRERNAMLAVLRRRDFRLVFIGETISLLGDQFSLIALPWLVLKLTADPLAMGTVLALAGIPRALFILVGGALSDRFSPRRVMLASNLGRMLLVGILAALVMTRVIELWMVYLFALCFGLADAFFFPAQGSIVPQLVAKNELQAANSLVQGMAQLSQIAGPVVAGALIAVLTGSPSTAQAQAAAAPNIYGIGIAFAIDALTFAVSVATLWMIGTLPNPDGAEQGTASQPVDTSRNLFSSIAQGAAFVWNDQVLRWLFGIVAAVEFLAVGPFMVGIPVLADTRLPEGAMAFGIVMSAWGGGSLLGVILAGTLPRPSPRHLGRVMLTLAGTFGPGLMVYGLVPSTPALALTTACLGAANGYVVILFISWLQQRVPTTLLGRTMSLLIFASIGLLPVSQAMSGALVKLDIRAMFLGAGLLICAVVARAWLVPAVRDFGLLASQPAEDVQEDKEGV